MWSYIANIVAYQSQSKDILSIAHMAKEGYKRTMLRITVVYEWLLIEAKKRDQYSFLCTMMKYLRFLFTYISNYFYRRLLIFITTSAVEANFHV